MIRSYIDNKQWMGSGRIAFLFILLISYFSFLPCSAQTEARIEAMANVGSGDHNPLWLNANKYGLSSLKNNNGYLRGDVARRMTQDSTRRWAWGAELDVAVAAGFASTVVVHQAYGELRWLKGLLTVGSKEQPMELKNQELSSGSQTLGINARPVPSIRLSLPEYWNIPGLGKWVALKGHIAYGIQTDNKWQEDFTNGRSRYSKNTRLHTKAGFLRIGRDDKPLTAELGLEMACQYGGTAHHVLKEEGGYWDEMKNTGGLKGAVKALFPSGGETMEAGSSYENAEGNHLGSWMMRINFDQPKWGVSAYAEHLFEDHSSMFFLDYNGYGTGDEWDKKKDSKWFLYDLKDIMAGVELRLKDFRWISNVVCEYIYTMYQSGPVYHDHTQQMPDHISGLDNYYNHHIFAGWQHWGQVMGNPLFRSPLYNDNGVIDIEDNRFRAWHLAAAGSPMEGLRYRLMCTWQRGLGTYHHPFVYPRRNTSMMAEASYSFADGSRLEGWQLKGAVALDHGELLGDNFGVQLTVAKRLRIK